MSVEKKKKHLETEQDLPHTDEGKVLKLALAGKTQKRNLKNDWVWVVQENDLQYLINTGISNTQQYYIKHPLLTSHKTQPLHFEKQFILILIIYPLQIYSSVLRPNKFWNMTDSKNKM